MQFATTQTQTEARMGRERNASFMLTLGWIILGFAVMLGVFWYNSVKDGDLFWRAMTGSIGFIGAVLIGVGNYFRKFA